MKVIWSPSVSCRMPRKLATVTFSAAWRSAIVPIPRTGWPALWRSLIASAPRLTSPPGEYYWNSGMFMFRAKKYLIELAKIPSGYPRKPARAAVNAADNGSDFINIPHDIFCECPDESVDYAVMEKTADAVVVGLDADWSDVGSGPHYGRSARKTSRATSLVATRGYTTAKTATSTATRS